MHIQTGMIPLFFYRNKVCIKAIRSHPMRLAAEKIACIFFHLDNLVADPHDFDADPDPAFYFNADSDPTFHFDVGPEPNPDPSRPLTFL
jgi:hypothetical protein